MDFFFNSLRKLLTFTCITAMVAVFVYVPKPHFEVVEELSVPQAEAFTFIDPTNLVQNTVTAVNSLSIFTKEFVLDNLAWILAKSIISSMVADTITWINSGFRGSPAFVQDLDGFLLNVADETAGAFIQSLGPNNPLSFLCSPFALDIQIALALEYEVARDRIPYRGCRISDFTGDFEQFIDGNFSQGNWVDWFRISAEPEVYTPLGAYYAAQESLQENIRAEEAAERDTVANGRGFLSFRVCSGSTLGINGETIETDCKVNTPGSTIATRLSDSLGLGEDTLVTADELNELIGSLISQLAVQALTGTAGLLGLSANTGQTYGGFNAGSYVDSLRQEGSGNVTGSLNNTISDLEDELDQMQDFRDIAQDYRQDFLQINQTRRADLTPQQVGFLDDALRSTQEVITRLNLEIPSFQADINEYRDLEFQLSNGQLSSSEEAVLRRQQLDVLNRINGAGYMDAIQFSGFQQQWDATLDNLEPV